MKKIVLVMLILSIFWIHSTAAEAKFTLGGFTQLEYGTDNPLINPDSIHLGDTITTIRPMFTWENEGFKLHLEPNFGEIRVEDSNWLKEAWIGYKFNEGFSFRVGRIPRSTILLTPHPRHLQLARYPRIPGSIFGWGTQLSQKWDRVICLWDVTTDSAPSFQDSSSFSGIESSLRLQYNLTKEWFLAGNIAYDFTDPERFSAVNLGYSSDTWNLNVVAYSKENVHGGFVMAAYQVCKSFEIHGVIDVQDSNGSSQVLGTRFFFGDRSNTDLTVDYIHSDFKKNEHTLAIRLRHRF